MTTVTTAKPTKHPAKFNDDLMSVIRTVVLDDMVEREVRHYAILDPLAGVGTIHKLRSAHIHTVGIELEPEWAEQHPDTITGDSLKILRMWTDPRRPEREGYNAVITSPCYGNRMADHHEAKDKSARNTYRHKLGRPLTGGSSAGLQWTTSHDDEYKAFHRELWALAVQMIEPGGIFVLNIKDHIRKQEIMKVTDWHIATLTALGLRLEAMRKVWATGNRQGQNGDARIEYEWIVTLRKPAATDGSAK